MSNVNVIKAKKPSMGLEPITSALEMQRAFIAPRRPSCGMRAMGSDKNKTTSMTTTRLSFWSEDENLSEKENRRAELVLTYKPNSISMDYPYLVAGQALEGNGRVWLYQYDENKNDFILLHLITTPHTGTTIMPGFGIQCLLHKPYLFIMDCSRPFYRGSIWSYHITRGELKSIYESPPGFCILSHSSAYCPIWCSNYHAFDNEFHIKAHIINKSTLVTHSIQIIIEGCPLT